LILHIRVLAGQEFSFEHREDSFVYLPLVLRE
jgi:hypothetical protein